MHFEKIILIIAIAVLTFTTRFLFIFLLKNKPFSERAVRWLKYIPISILTTLIAPTLFVTDRKLNLSLHNDYLIAGIVACLVAYKTRNILATIGVGMLIILSLRFAFNFGIL